MGPPKLEGNFAENWRKWSQRWNLYAKASGTDSKGEATKCAISITYPGSFSPLKLYAHLNMPFRAVLKRVK